MVEDRNECDVFAVCLLKGSGVVISLVCEYFHAPIGPKQLPALMLGATAASVVKGNFLPMTMVAGI